MSTVNTIKLPIEISSSEIKFLEISTSDIVNIVASRDKFIPTYEFHLSQGEVYVLRADEFLALAQERYQDEYHNLSKLLRENQLMGL